MDRMIAWTRHKSRTGTPTFLFDAAFARFGGGRCAAHREELEIEMGRFHEKPVGPHPCTAIKWRSERQARAA